MAKEIAVTERLEKEREQVKERVNHSMSRTSSHTASQRGDTAPSRGSATPSSPKADSPKPVASNANVRPSFSFASAAAGKKDAPSQPNDGQEVDEVKDVTEKIGDVQLS